MTATWNPRVTPWQIDEHDFPTQGTAHAQKEFLIGYAVLAPSGHNTQPWSFHITDDAIEVRSDASRRLAAADPDNRELLISIGTAVANLRVAAAHFGLATSVTYRDTSAGGTPTAVVTFGGGNDVDDDLRPLFPSIARRRTVRSGFEARPIDPETLEHLCQIVDGSDAVRFIVPHERARVGELVEDADQRLMNDEQWRRELSDWVRPNETSAADGICGDAFGIPGPLSQFAPWLVRTFDLGEALGVQDREKIINAAGLIVMTGDDDPASLMRAGETLERLLLGLTSLGVAYSFVNQPVQVPELRRELWKLIRTARPPQILLRIGYATATPRATPRRPVGAVVV